MRLIVCSLLLILMLPGAPGQTHKRSSSRIQPGAFDYYILSLSWAPDFCARPNAQHDPRECAPGRRLGFVVHGLWPQLDNGGHPSQCSPASPVASDIVQRALSLIPSESLIQHEWRDHGTCSGLGAAAYFDTIRRAFGSVKIPPDYQQPAQRIDASPHDIEGKFIAANPALKNSLRVTCSGGELAEVRICLAKDLSARACSTHDAECPASRVTMLPVK
jgi:ribonuclease T2